MQFPKNFYFGAATAAHQVEGGNRNDWTEWEKTNAQRLAAEAEPKFKHVAVWDDVKIQAQDPENYISGKATNHYHRFEEDFDIAARLGHNAHRFSIEWARVEPEEGKFDEREIAHYQNVIMALRERKIEPFVTLWHFTLPQWFSKMGGFLHPDASRLFARYCAHVVSALGGMARFFFTMNEPEIYASNAYWKGVWPPQKKGLGAYLRVNKALMRAHNAAYAVIKKSIPSCTVGIVKDNIHFQGLLAPLARWWWNHRFLQKTRFDCIGLNYYFGGCDTKQKSDMDWSVCPEGIYRVLQELHRYTKPVYITENGVADMRDAMRADFIKNHVEQTAKAIRAGVDVRGYFYWSLLDNFEWDKGFWPRFGLVEIDYKTFERKIRPSAWEYARLIKDSRQ